MPVMEVEPPVAGSPPYPALIALHGNNHSAAGAMPFWQGASQKGYLVAMAQSSQGGGVNGYVWNDTRRAQQEVVEQYHALIDRHQIDQERTVIGGFSLGGGLACWLAVSRALPVRGFIAAGPYFKLFKGWEPQIERAAAGGLRGYLVIGERDRICYEDTLALHRMLEACHVPCQIKVYPGLRHEYPADFDAVLGEALDFILNT